MINKAPIIIEKLDNKEPTDITQAVYQRDADHKYYLKAIYEWGNEPCEHQSSSKFYAGSVEKIKKRRGCAKCWQSLQQEGK